jgi:hypothetical protein
LALSSFKSGTFSRGDRNLDYKQVRACYGGDDGDDGDTFNGI